MLLTLRLQLLMLQYEKEIGVKRDVVLKGELWHDRLHQSSKIAHSRFMRPLCQSIGQFHIIHAYLVSLK